MDGDGNSVLGTTVGKAEVGVKSEGVFGELDEDIMAAYPGESCKQARENNPI